ncbi:MAG: DUF1840 family protein [Lysobacterales bacterium]
MAVTFSTRSHPRVIQLDHVARSLLKMMGCANEVPGAIRPENVEAARDKLRQALTLCADDGVEAQDKSSEQEDDELVSVSRRAQPLLDLLDTAAQKRNHVIWE